MEALANLCTTVVGKVLLAIVVWFVGKFIVSKIMGLVGKIKVLEKVEPNTRTFVLSALKWLLYIVLALRSPSHFRARFQTSPAASCWSSSARSK